MNREDLEKIRLETMRGLEKYRRLQERLAARQGPAAPGDMYCPPETTDSDIRWLVTSLHPRNNELLFVVPFDTHFLAGSADLRLPREATLGPLIVRARYGIWIDRATLQRGTRVAVLQEEFVGMVNNQLESLSRDELSPSDEQLTTDEDLDYLDWCDEIAGSRRQWERFSTRADRTDDLDSQPVLLSIKDFVPPAPAGPIDLQIQEVLAAENEQADDDVALLETSNATKTYNVDCELPGQVTMAWEPDGIRLYYASHTGEAPPVAAGLDNQDQSFDIDWVPSPSGKMFRGRPIVPWHEGSATVILSTERNRTITVRNE